MDQIWESDGLIINYLQTYVYLHTIEHKKLQHPRQSLHLNTQRGSFAYNELYDDSEDEHKDDRMDDNISVKTKEKLGDK